MDENPNAGSGAIDEYGGEPQKDDAPQDCAAMPHECEIAPGNVDAASPDTSFQADDELYETFDAKPIPIGINKDDGLPQPIDEPLQFAPPFSHETVVCIEDDREYVELTAEDLLARKWERAYGGSGDIWITPAGCEIRNMSVHSRYDECGDERKLDVFEPSAVKKSYGCDFVAEDGHLIPVRPRRERCRHYFRQALGNDDQPDPRLHGHRIFFRRCAILRSNGGAFMSVRDEAVYACDHRDPFDAETVTRFLDVPDHAAIREKRHLKMVPAWGQAGEVRERADVAEPLTGGIFSG